jgi:hypothetical protein
MNDRNSWVSFPKTSAQIAAPVPVASMTHHMIGTREEWASIAMRDDHQWLQTNVPLSDDSPRSRARPVPSAFMMS